MWKPRLPAGPGGDGGTERASPTVERKIPLSATKPAGVRGHNRSPDAWNGRVPEDGRRPLSERTGTDRTGAGRSQHVRAAGTGVTATAVRERRGRQRSLGQRAGPDPAIPDTGPTVPLTAGCGATATAPAPQPSNWTPPASVYGQQPSPAPHNHRERGPASRPCLRRHDSSPGPPASRRPAGVAPSTGSPRPRARNRRPRTRDVPGRRRPSGGSDVSTARIRTWTSREVSARYRTLRWVIAFPGPFQHRQLRSAIPAR